jgi:hypothetical protein
MSAEGGILNIVGMNDLNFLLNGNPSQQKNEDDIIENKIFTKLFKRRTYSKYRNFGLQKFRIDYDGQRDLNLTSSSTFVFKISRYADLLSNAFLSFTLPDIWSPILPPDNIDGLEGNALSSNVQKWRGYEFKWIDYIGAMLIKKISITCGSYTLQSYDGDYIHCFAQKNLDETQRKKFENMIGHVPELNDPSINGCYPNAFYTSNVLGAEPSIRGRQLLIPLFAWFSLDYHNAFPLCAINTGLDLKITIELRPICELFRIRDVTDEVFQFPYIAPDFNVPQFQMYHFLQTPPEADLSYNSYQNKTNTWNANIHLMCEYVFLDEYDRNWMARNNLVYLIKDPYRSDYKNISQSNRLNVITSGMVSSYTFYLQRNDVFKRNEWTNYTNYPYKDKPLMLQFAPTIANIPRLGNVGPYYNNQYPTGIYITGEFNADNQWEILRTFSPVIDGKYREKEVLSILYRDLEAFIKNVGCSQKGLYFYSFATNENNFLYQPTGAFNTSYYERIEMEITTIPPPIDQQNSFVATVCDENGIFQGTRKENWRLNEYSFDLVLFEERYNVVSFQGGSCGLLYQR